MNSSDTVLLPVDRDSRSTSSPTGSPTPAYLRVETPASIRFITTTVSGSRSAKYSYVLTGSSRSSSAERTRGRRTSTRRPPSVIDPRSCPWRLAVRSKLCLPFGPTTSDTSASINSCTTESPTPTLSARSPSLAAPTSSPSATSISAGSGLSSASLGVTTCGPGTFFMADSSCPRGLVDTPNALNRSGRGGRTAASNFYEISDNL
jgi:hypothetical protein